MRLTAAIQEALIAILCYDDSLTGSRYVRALVPPATYDPFFKSIASEASDYLDRYGEPPKSHLLDIIDTLKAREPKSAEIYEQIYQSLEQTKKRINKEYTLAQATAFARYQGLKRGISSALDQLESGRVELAEKAILDSIKVNTELFDPGVLFSDPKQSLRFLDMHDDSFPCGIRELDYKGMGPTRKQLHLFVAPPGRGKSWWLVHLCKQAMANRIKAVYVTLELSEEVVAQRCVQSFFSISKRRDSDIQRQAFESDEIGKFISMDTVKVKERPSLKDATIASTLTNKIKKTQSRPPLIIKEFATGSITVQDLEAYLDTLEAARGIVPDLLVIDYADLLKVGSSNYRTDLGQLYKDLRGLAVKRNIAIATASQSNRGSLDVRVVTEKHLAEDFSKAMTADTVITYNQTADEKELGLARLYVAKGRADKDKFTVLISQAYAIGQFCFDSVGMVNTYWDYVEGNNGDDDG